MKKLFPAVFIFVAALLVCVFILKQFLQSVEVSASAKEIVPQVDNSQNVDNDSLSYGDDYNYSSFISLTKDETLLSVVTMDLDGDGNEDQINVCKVANNPYIILIAGLYNPQKATYERQAYIATNVTQVQTFACTSLDVLGNHKNALIYQGDTENGTSVLRIFIGGRKNGKFSLNMIGDFDADGRVFIQQSERNEAYEMGQAKGAAFPVWVYTSASEENRRLDQIQTQYEYSEEEGKYIETRTIRIPGSHIAARELARIQDGTVATFANFLEGLWYKTENEAAVRYIFFDYKNKEIIFQYEDSVEVYNWLKSNLRRNGMYFSSVNKTIENLQRRFDISLVSTDEVRIRIQDDVRMIIGESNLWDGNYKKVKSKDVSSKAYKGEVFAELLKGPVWVTADGTTVNFSQNGYFVENANINDSGRLISQKINDGEIIQFRSENTPSYFNGFYEPKFLTTEVPKTVKNQTIKVTETDKNTILLQSIVVNPEGYYQTESMPIVLHRSQSKR